MTFNRAAWAIDGATINSALARTEAYASLGDAQGVAKRTDLKVSALATPGQGVRIDPGAAVILNGYQGTSVNQSYIVTNPDVHTLSPQEMPASNAAAKDYFVVVTIGDPEFDQGGHPWMAADDPAPGTEDNFQYVRPYVLGPFNPGTTFESLTLPYPALPLAKLAIPAGTTTIQQNYITDLRSLVSPRSLMTIGNVTAGGANPLNGLGGNPGSYERWPNLGVVSVKVPAWATTAKIIGFVEGARLTKAANARLRVMVDGTSLTTAITNVDESAPRTGADRVSYNVGGEINVSTVAGTNRVFSLYGTPNNEASKGGLTTDASTSVVLQVFFEEKPI